MRVYRHRKVGTEIIRIGKKHRSHDLDEYVRAFERLMVAGQFPGHGEIPGLGLTRGGSPASIWKGRVIFPPLGGKSHGPRYIYERIEVGGEEIFVCLTIYTHQDGTKEQDARDRACERWLDFDGTVPGSKALEPVDLSRRVR